MKSKVRFAISIRLEYLNYLKFCSNITINQSICVALPRVRKRISRREKARRRRSPRSLRDRVFYSISISRGRLSPREPRTTRICVPSLCESYGEITILNRNASDVVVRPSRSSRMRPTDPLPALSKKSPRKS